MLFQALLLDGILTLIYSVNSNYKYINQLFEKSIDKIFKKKLLGGIIGSKYRNKELKKFIYEIVEDKKLSDIKQNKIIIPTLDFNLNQPRIFDNINLDQRLDVPLWYIALATAAAPTYFPAIEYTWKILQKLSLAELNKKPINEQIYLLTKEMMDKKISKSVLIDGGVIQNIPVITTYTSLRSELGIKPENIDMFIIGTGEDLSSKNITTKEVNNWTCFDWLTNFLIPYVTESNETTSIYWGSQMGFNSFCYFNPLKVSGNLDNINVIPNLKNQCEQITQNFKQELFQFLER